MTEWQMIETAPRDGEYMIVQHEGYALSDTPARFWAGEWRMRGVPDPRRPYGFMNLYSHPTHWRPVIDDDWDRYTFFYPGALWALSDEEVDGILAKMEPGA